MTKVAVLLHGLGANGIDSLFANLSEHFAPDMDIWYFLAVDNDSEQFWEERVRRTGVHLVKLHDLDKGRLRRWPATLRGVLRRYGPFDVVHSNMDMLNGVNMLVAQLCGVPRRISHAHRSSSEPASGMAARIAQNAYRGTMKGLMLACSTARLSCSEVAGEYFFGHRPFTLLYNGIDVATLAKRPPRGQDSDRPVFIAIGRLGMQKNPLKLVQIFHEIVKRRPGARLIWIGDGGMRDQIAEEINRFGIGAHIERIPRTDQVPSYLHRADYMLMPSLFEGLSLALAEAQAAGVDCFVSDTCSHMSDCGRCLFIPLDDTPRQWADTILSYIDGGTRMTIDPDRLRQFDIRSVASDLQEIYRGGSK